NLFAKLAQARMEIGGGSFCFHSAVDEADKIRKMVISEQPGNGFLPQLKSPGLEQAVGIGGEDRLNAEKDSVQRSTEHAFIRAKPLEAFLRSDGERLIRDGTFGWPQA